MSRDTQAGHMLSRNIIKTKGCCSLGKGEAAQPCLTCQHGGNRPLFATRAAHMQPIPEPRSNKPKFSSQTKELALAPCSAPATQAPKITRAEKGQSLLQRGKPSPQLDRNEPPRVPGHKSSETEVKAECQPTHDMVMFSCVLRQLLMGQSQLRSALQLAACHNTSPWPWENIRSCFSFALSQTAPQS